MYIQRTLRNAFLAELLLFLMVANCAPSRPREDVGQAPGDPASLHHHAAASRSAKRTPGAGSSAIASGHQGKYRLSTACSQRGKLTGKTSGDLLRFLPGGGVDALGGPTDPDTEVRLISSKLGHFVWIFSPSRNRYLCFNKNGKLVTKKTPYQNGTFCQFEDRFVHNSQRRLISVRNSKQSQRLPPFGPFSANPATQRTTHEIDLNAWQVGFGRSGEPLKGSGWRTSKWSSTCYDIVYHEEPVRSVTHHAPVASKDMFLIFQELGLDKSKGSTVNQLNNKPNKSGANKNQDRKTSSGKQGAKKGAKSSAHHGGKQRKPTGEKHGNTRTTPEHSTTQASLPLIEEVERRTNDVSFDSLLAETEQLLSLAKALPAAAAASLVPEDDAVEHPAPRHRSTFILLDSGGWQEVVVGQRPESQQPARQGDDISGSPA